MKDKVIEFTKHPLISLSVVIVLGSLVSSFFSFLFNLFMSRNLSVADYGTLTSLVSLITLATMPAGAILPTIVHFSAKYFAHNDEAMAYGLFYKVGKLALGIGLLFLLIFIFGSTHIASFFKITDSSLLILPGLVVFCSYLAIMNSGFLQAKLAFGFLTLSQFIGSLFKLVLGVVLVLLGMGVSGGMWAFFLAYFVPYIVTFIPLRFLFTKRKVVDAISLKELLSYGAPSALTLICLSSFITVDTLVVKHFFDPKSAGIYAGISLLGRIIFFVSSPIGTVMFPLVVQKHAKRESIRSTFILAMLLVFLPSLALTIGYFLLPNLVIQLSLKNDDYLQGAALLGFMGIYLTVYSLLYLLANFYLSIKKTIVTIPIVIGSVAQLLLIWFFHEDFFQVVFISTGIVSVLLLFLLVYLQLYVRKKN